LGAEAVWPNEIVVGKVQEATTRQWNNATCAAFDPELFEPIMTLRALASFGDPVYAAQSRFPGFAPRAGSNELTFIL
jgi:hypothetical protein